MKSNLKLVSLAIVSFLLIVSCTKEVKKDDFPVNKEVEHTTRDFTKGIMTIDYTDGTKSITKIPIDSTPFISQKSLTSSRIADETWVQSAITESPQLTPEYQVETYPFDNFVYSSDLYETYGMGPTVWTRPHVSLLKADGLIVGYANPWVEITKNQSAYYSYKTWNVTRTATIIGLTFVPGSVNVPVAICEWSYYISYYFTYIPYSSPKTKQLSYTDIRYVQ